MSKNYRFVLAFVAVAVVFVAAGGARNEAQETPADPAARLEFQAVKFSSGESTEYLTKRLNALAGDGWQRAFVVANQTEETGNKRSDRYNRVTRTTTYIAYQRPAR